ncbi:MAG: hypothetical protein NC453_28965 [Muribaculum sp.]|nr:hypothetical protein [Muribaculum sp.]
MEKVTANEILREQSLERLIEAYYEEFRYDSRLPELFEMIEPEKLREWLIVRFLCESSRKEIIKIFGWEDEPTLRQFQCPRSGETITVDWDFIIEYYPGYHNSNTIAWEDDLDCALSGDCDDEKLARIKRDWGETREELEKAHDELYDEIVRDAIENYKKQCYEQTMEKPN